MFEHSAEAQIASLRNRCDYILDNNGNLKELRDSVLAIMKEELGVQRDYEG
jgi:dephospho-CoA kinase